VCPNIGSGVGWGRSALLEDSAVFGKDQQFWGPERSRRVLEGSGGIAMFWVVPKEYHLAVWGYHLS